MYTYVLFLFQVISDQHPNSLLILDDVWSSDVAQAFAVRCRTMVTSRNTAVASGIPSPQVHSVSVSNGMYLIVFCCYCAVKIKNLVLQQSGW